MGKILNVVDTRIEKVLNFLNSKPDKVAHFCLGYIISTIAPISPGAGLISAITIGILKEIYDKRHTDIHTPDKCDAYATIAGGILGCIALAIK